MCLFCKSMETFVYESRPMGFQPVVEIAALFGDGRLVALECASFKSEPGKWGVPAGKLEKGESPRRGARRELFEETGITVEESDLCPLVLLYIRKPTMEYAYHLFHLFLKNDSEKGFGGIQAMFDSEAIYIEGLWVEENLRNQGYGKKLLAAAEKESIKNGCRL